MEINLDRSVGSDRNLPAPTGGSQAKRLPKPSAETLNIIRSLDVRFPPSFGISEKDREAQVLLLASDVHDIPISLLDMAAREWVRTKSFMPKASELRNLAGDARRKAEDPDDRAAVGRRVAESYNERLAAEPTDKGIRWVYDEKSDTMKLVPLRDLHQRPVERCTPDEARTIRRDLRGEAFRDAGL